MTNYVVRVLKSQPELLLRMLSTMSVVGADHRAGHDAGNLLARSRQAQHGSLDLVSKVATPSFKYSTRILSNFARYMDEQLERLHLTGHVFAATIDIKFNVEPLPYAMLSRNTWGEPHIVRATLADDLRQFRSALFRGCCGKHDPIKENRSTRIYPG
jgi:hypothetical protein